MMKALRSRTARGFARNRVEEVGANLVPAELLAARSPFVTLAFIP